MEQLEIFASRDFVINEIRALLAGQDNRSNLATIREVILDMLREIIDKFPAMLQMEIIAVLADEYMEKWKKETGSA